MENENRTLQGGNKRENVKKGAGVTSVAVAGGILAAGGLAAKKITEKLSPTILDILKNTIKKFLRKR
mgnify:FL=1